MSENFYSEDIGFEPLVNFDDFNDIHIEIKNGSPKLIKDVDAIRQWILKFIITGKDTYEIYEGTGFGNRLRSLLGHKTVGLGYEEAEIERDFREGMPLCPAISRVAEFEISKSGKYLNIDMSCELFNGELVDVSVEKVYEVR